MTKKEICKKNREAAVARMQESAEYKEAQELIAECNEAYERGDHEASKKAYYKAERLLKEARKHLRA